MPLRSKPVYPSPSWPASPSLADLGDPVWQAAYREAGGNLRQPPQATSAQIENVGAILGSPGSMDDVEVSAADPQVDLARIPARTRSALTSPLPRPPASPPTIYDRVLEERHLTARGWLADNCPRALVCLDGARQALLRREEESPAHAAASCRRALEALADAVSPPHGEPIEDRGGKERNLGPAAYKNRLIHFFENAEDSPGTYRLSIAEVKRTAELLDRLIERLGKGLHDEHGHNDAVHLYASAWNLVAEISSTSN